SVDVQPGVCPTRSGYQGFTRGTDQQRGYQIRVTRQGAVSRDQGRTLCPPESGRRKSTIRRGHRREGGPLGLRRQVDLHVRLSEEAVVANGYPPGNAGEGDCRRAVAVFVRRGSEEGEGAFLDSRDHAVRCERGILAGSLTEAAGGCGELQDGAH